MLYDKKWDQEVKVLDEVGRKMHQAADWLEQHEWCQRFSCDAYGARCMAGALNLFFPAGHREALERVNAHTHCGIMCWNDREGRTKQEVIDMLRKAAWPVPYCEPNEE